MRDERPPGPEQTAASIGWREALLVMVICHGTATLLLRLVPAIAPELIEAYGWSESFIGWVATAANVGSILVVAGGTGLLRALGSTRAIRLGLFGAGLATLALTLPTPAVALAASLIVGLGHGPANPAGNDILNRYTPPRSQALIFSIKQASVPLGGVLGGLLMPVVAQELGVAAAFVLGAAIALAAVATTASIHRATKAPVSGPALRRSFSLENVLGPLGVTRASPPLRRLAITGFLLAFVQSVWFVYLTAFLALELGYSATAAGGLYALMQATTIVARVALGWWADRKGTAMPLIAGSLITSAAITAALSAAVLIPSPLYVIVVVFVAGFAAAGWNGVQVSETVRVADKTRLYESVSGVTLAIGTGVVLGPLAVSLLLDAGLEWGLILIMLSVLPLLGLPTALRGRD